MKKNLLVFGILLAAGVASEARAQASLLANGIGAGINLIRMANRQKAAAAAPPTPTAEQYRGQSYPVLRTPAGQLPKKGEAEIR